jgi:MoaA/NifB/PqqE/SkfB family radical SAM enzyme
MKPSAVRSCLETLRLVLKDGGPGFCQFAVTNACNARCAFCNFARDRLDHRRWRFVPLERAIDAVDILLREGIRYLVITGGEPLLHRNLDEIVRHAADRSMKVILVTNGWLLLPERIAELADAGISSFIISIDAATKKAHEENRGLEGVCRKIREANGLIHKLGLPSTASVTMSRLVDYGARPGVLRSLGFRSLTFSYPVTDLGSSFLGFSDSHLVDYSEAEIIEAFEQVKGLKRRFQVVNPTPSLEEMQRVVRKEKQQFPCLAGYRYFYLDWNLDIWRCHHWENPMCSIYEFDGSRQVRDGCTRCMLDCYRDSSVMQQIGVSIHDTYCALKAGKFVQAAKALWDPGNLGSIRAILEELSWLLRF